MNVELAKGNALRENDPHRLCLKGALLRVCAAKAGGGC